MSKINYHSHSQEEIINKIWPPTQPVESTEWENTPWEILNPHSSNPHEDTRHWFKQNYTNHNRTPDKAIIYH